MQSRSLLTTVLLATAFTPATALVDAAPAGASNATWTRAVDTDGDGIDDSIDGCPSAAAPTPTGCPSAPRKAHLRWQDGRNRLIVKVTSNVTGCAAGARLTLWRQRSGQDEKVAGATASSSGQARFRAKPRSTYYVIVSPSYVSGVAECSRATSRKVRVPR